MISPYVLILFFVTTKMHLQSMKLMLPFLTKATTILEFVRLTFVYPSHQDMYVKFGIKVIQ